jgi:type II secretory pathway component HofQ
MGFAKPFHVVYDQMSLSDETSEKNLLIQLADRDIISHETVLERFKEVPTVEKVRLQREEKLREKDKFPDKASPFHNANHQQDMEKITKQGEINEKMKKESAPKGDNQGRPENVIETQKRKKKVVKPKTSPGVAEMFVWATSAFESTQHINKGYLDIKGKSNARQLTKDEAAELEDIKLAAFLALDPMCKLSDVNLHKALSKNNVIPNEFKYIRSNSHNMENYKKMVIGLYVEQFFNEN